MSNIVLKRPEALEGALTFDQIGQLEVVAKADTVASRNDLVLRAQELEQVVNPETQQLAVSLIRELKALSNTTEEVRKTIKEPVLTLGKRIDTVAKDFTAPITAELDRLQKALNAYTTAEAKRLAAIEAERQAKLAELESERKALEAQASLSTNAAEVQQLTNRQTEIKRAQSQALTGPTVSKVAGTKSRTVWKFDVVSLIELFRHRPDLCHIEPDNAAIQKAIKEGMRECPGLANIHEEKTVIV